jgi:HEPN domain-containing protein
LALKYYLWDKKGAYPGTHDLETLAFKECQDLNFSEEEMAGIKNLNKQYLEDGEFPYPSRYRPTSGRIFVSPSQDILEEVISKIVRSTSHPELVKRILAR